MAGAVAAVADNDYLPRHECTLPRLTVGMGIVSAGRVATCPGCQRVWLSVWGRDPGGESQPQWVFFPQILDLMARTPIINRALPVVTAILVGGSATVTVKWDEPFPDVDYRVKVVLPVALVGKATCTVTSQTKTDAVITLTATALVAAGSVLDVTAYRYG